MYFFDSIWIFVVVIRKRDGEPVLDPSSSDLAKPLHVKGTDSLRMNAVIGDEVVGDDLEAPVVLSQGSSVEDSTHSVIHDEAVEVRNRVKALAFRSRIESTDPLRELYAGLSCDADGLPEEGGFRVEVEDVAVDMVLLGCGRLVN